MGRIVVVSTGGTIASRWQGSGWAAEAKGGELLAAACVPRGLAVEVIDLFTVNSARITTEQQYSLLSTVHSVLDDPNVDGVVVTHGTDTLEESAFLLDVYHHDRRPVVFTGAQRPLDADDSDASANLHDALVAAACVRGLGVLVAFDGLVHAARGTVKRHTLAPDAFGDPSGSHIGDVGENLVLVQHRPHRSAPLPLPPTDALVPRVDVVMHHTGADPGLLQAAVNVGAKGIVLVGTGAGNATPEFAKAVHRVVEAGVLVALTTRVAAGPVAELYTGGGAVDLVAAGAVPADTLRAAQARIAVVAAVLAGSDTPGRTKVLKQLLGGPTDPNAVADAYAEKGAAHV